MTYNEYISQFEILDNPPIKEGFQRHHIVPRSQQTEKDERCVYLTPAQHGYAHWLFDNENGTDTCYLFVGKAGKNLSDITGFDDFKLLDFKPWITDEHKKKISQSTLGSNNWNYGNHLSEETKKKISVANKGRIHHSEEQKKKWSIERKGHIVLDETKKKISESNKGHIASEESRKKMSESQKKRFLDKTNHPRYGLTGEKCPCYGKHWWNNGDTEILSYEQPEGFVKGRLSSVMAVVGMKHRKSV